MSDSTTVKGSHSLAAVKSFGNSAMFSIQKAIMNTVETAEVVMVTAVQPGGSGSAAGYVSVKPLVCRLDSRNNAVPSSELFQIPYSRVQGGKAALVIDPMPGDIGLAVFAKSDSSGVAPGTEEPAAPKSFRSFDKADGFYVGGFLNQAPEIYLELTQEGEAVLKAPQKIILDAPLVEITGQLSQGTGEGAGGTATFNGSIHATGDVRSDGDQIAGSVSQKSHVHTGVEHGSHNTGGPR